MSDREFISGHAIAALRQWADRADVESTDFAALRQVVNMIIGAELQRCVEACTVVSLKHRLSYDRTMEYSAAISNLSDQRTPKENE